MKGAVGRHLPDALFQKIERRLFPGRVDRLIDILCRWNVRQRRREAHTGLSQFLRHPLQRDIRQARLAARVAAAHVCMSTEEPNLDNAGSCIPLGDREIAAHLIDSHCMKAVFDLRTQCRIGESVYIETRVACVDRNAQRSHRIPHRHALDVDICDQTIRLELAAQKTLHHVDHGVAQFREFAGALQRYALGLAPCGKAKAVGRILVSHVVGGWIEQADFDDHAGQRSCGVCAAAESNDMNFVAGRIVA